MARLFACFGCNIITKMRDAAPGAHPNEDWELVNVIERHKPHVRAIEERNEARRRRNADTSEFELPAQIYSCGDDLYEVLDMEQQIREQAAKQYGKILGEMKDQMVEDAMECFAKHGRPSIADGCVDFETDAKRLTPKSTPKHAQRHLCSFCPLGQLWKTDDVTRFGARRGSRGTVLSQQRGVPAGMRQISLEQVRRRGRR